MTEQTFYIYVYLDPTKPGQYVYDNLSFDFEPFYVGKGTEGRWLYHLKITENSSAYVNKFKHNKINKIRSLGYEPYIKVLPIIFLDESEAYQKEKEVIDLIGLRILGTGPLTNLTSGGVGASSGILNPMYGKTHTIEARKKIGEASKGRIPPTKGRKVPKEQIDRWRELVKGKFEGELNPMYGRNHTEECKALMSANRKGKCVGVDNHNYGKCLSKEVKEKLRLAQLGKKHTEESKIFMKIVSTRYMYILEHEDGTVINCYDLPEFCKALPIDDSYFRKNLKLSKSVKGWSGTKVALPYKWYTLEEYKDIVNELFKKHIRT